MYICHYTCSPFDAVGLVKVKVKADKALPAGNRTSELRDVTCHMGSHSVCYLPPHTSERALPNPSHAGWYSIYLPRRDGRQQGRTFCL